MCVLSSGETAFEAHHLPVDKKIRKGELVNIDFVASFDGYCSDIARMAVVGEPNGTQESIYKLALEVQEKVAEAMVFGGRVIEAYDAAVETVARAGHDFNLPFVGHSMEIALHENPFVGPSHGDWKFDRACSSRLSPFSCTRGCVYTPRTPS
jgi:Xaa-Pro aminopeptidase